MMKNNQLYIEDHILMLPSYPTPEKHQHLAAHLILSDVDKLHCQIGNHEIKASAVMIASEISHTVLVGKGQMIVLIFDAASELSINMEKMYLSGHPYYILPDKLTEEIRQIWKQSAGNLIWFDDRLLEALKLRNNKYVMDMRIEECIAYLKRLETIPKNIYELSCQRACLSKSRFSHLFRQSVGAPFNRYLMMIRLRKAYEGYLQGKNITEISMDSGFDSPSHFAATMRRIFGLSFSDFSKNM